jgi:hypothetical protein
MKFQRMLWSVVSLIAVSCGCITAQTATPAALHVTQSSVAPFLGRWDLTLNTSYGQMPSWLDLSQSDGTLKAKMVGRWGNARPLPKVEITHGVLTFVSPKEEENSNTDMVFKGKLVGGMLRGTLTAPGGATWTWIGKRAPSLATTKSPQWGKPISLFNGKNLNGWHEYSAGGVAQTRHWTVVNGALVSPGRGPELVNDKQFNNFKLHLEWNCGPTSNSGVYLRGRYEVQIENESMDEPPSHHTGGVYGFLAPSPELSRTAGKWHTFDITLIGRKVTVVQDGKTIIDDKGIPGITGGALNSNEGQPGPIMLQGSEKGNVSFRNIVITPAIN